MGTISVAILALLFIPATQLRTKLIRLDVRAGSTFGISLLAGAGPARIMVENDLVRHAYDIGPHDALDALVAMKADSAVPLVLGMGGVSHAGFSASYDSEVRLVALGQKSVDYILSDSCLTNNVADPRRSAFVLLAIKGVSARHIVERRIWAESRAQQTSNLIAIRDCINQFILLAGATNDVIFRYQDSKLLEKFVHDLRTERPARGLVRRGVSR